MTNIQDFYAGRSIFITGATGFMGKVLVEKLLRSCPTIGNIYVLVRPKKGQSPKERIETILESKLFEKLHNERPDFKEKVVAVAGDIIEPGLGISQTDADTLLSEVSIAFHSAATVRFDEPLKLSLKMNVLGTKEMMCFCQKMQKLEAFVHVSTAYANCDRQEIAEAVYPPPLKPEKLLAVAEWMDEDIIDTLTPSFIKPRPNTYTYTKAMAEHYLTDNRDNLPCAIVRPSIVGASLNEPFPGWVDNFNGPTGLLAAIGKGLLRIMKGNFNATANIIPVDIATNLMIASAWYTALERPKHVIVYNCTTGQTNRLTWGMMERLSCKYFMEHPLDDAVRVPDPRFTSSRIWHDLNMWFDQYLPAWCMDALLRLSGRKPRMMRIQSKLQKSVGNLDYFTSNQWVFANENMFSLYEKLTPEDKQEFNFDVHDIEWDKYLENYCIGTKVYALKEDLQKLPQAKRNLHRLRRRNQIISAIIIIIVWRLSIKRFQVVRSLWYYALGMAMKIVSKIPKYARAS